MTTPAPSPAALGRRYTDASVVVAQELGRGPVAPDLGAAERAWGARWDAWAAETGHVAYDPGGEG